MRSVWSTVHPHKKKPAKCCVKKKGSERHSSESPDSLSRCRHLYPMSWVAAKTANKQHSHTHTLVWAMEIERREHFVSKMFRVSPRSSSENISNQRLRVLEESFLARKRLSATLRWKAAESKINAVKCFGYRSEATCTSE